MNQELLELADTLNKAREMAEGVKLDYIIPDPAETDVIYSQISIALANVLVHLCGEEWESVFDIILKGYSVRDALFIAEDPENRM